MQTVSRLIQPVRLIQIVVVYRPTLGGVIKVKHPNK